MQYVRISEAAAMLQLSPQTVRTLVKDGVIPGKKINPHSRNSPIRIKLSDLEKYMRKVEAGHSG